MEKGKSSNIGSSVGKLEDKIWSKNCHSFFLRTWHLFISSYHNTVVLKVRCLYPKVCFWFLTYVGKYPQSRVLKNGMAFKFTDESDSNNSRKNQFLVKYYSRFLSKNLRNTVIIWILVLKLSRYTARIIFRS